MRKILLLAVVFATSFTAFGQDFSNKGKEFWLCFPTHVPSSNNATLSIYITGDKASSGTITMPNGAFSGNFTIAANGISEIQIPWAANRHINGATESNMVLNKSIHIKTNAGQPPVVAYAQQWAGARSTATLLLPVNVLGTKYYSMNFAQDGGGRSQFQIIATKPNTVVEITAMKDGAKDPTITITLPLAGDMYQYWSTTGNQDLTGTFIESVASGSGGCKPIAVSSGSSNIRIGTAVPSCTGASSDPLWQQLYPVATWGKNFGFIPFADYLLRGNPYRVMASEANTKVLFDGVLVATLNAGEIYPAAFSGSPVTLSNPTSITADKPICVAQYAQSDACTGQTAASRVGDPDMVILNPIEQNISDITVFSSTNQSITRQYANILMKTIAIPSFRISRNGGPLNPPTGTWQAFGPLPGYSYLRESLTGSTAIRMRSDSGFNAIAYGWGNVESYAYSAGTNVKDLYQQIAVQTQYGIETTPSVCTNSPFKFKVSLPYCADSIRWDLSALPGPPVPTIDTIRYNTCIPTYPLPGGPDSTTVVNGVTLYWYSLPTFYSFSTIGTYPVSITTYAPNTSGCGSEQLIDFDLQISDPPTASFSFNTPGCYLEPVTVSETTPQSPKTTYRTWWEFYDPATSPPTTTVYTNAPPYPPNTPAAIRTQSHMFTTPGVKRIRHASITTPGCLSDTIVQFVTLPDIPNATIAGNTTPACINTGTPPDVTFTATDGTPAFIFTYTVDAGSGPGAPQTINSIGNSITFQHPVNVAGDFTYNLIGVSNATPAGTPCTRTVTGQTVTVHITPDATINLSSAAGTDGQTVCINNALPVAITYNIGGSGNNATVTGLPPGVNGVFTPSAGGGTFTITGTPTSAIGSPFTYTVQTDGPCFKPFITGTITVNDDALIALTTPGTDIQTKCINTPIDDIIYQVSGGGTGATITWNPVPGVPAGINFTPLGGNAFRIWGTPTVASTLANPYRYTINTTGPCIKPALTGTLNVTPDATISLSSAVGTDAQTVCINTNITSITYNIGLSGNNATVSGLPPGVNGVFTANPAGGGTFTITGAPSTAVGSPFMYTVFTDGPCGKPSIPGTITVTEDGVINHVAGSGSEAQIHCRNIAIDPIDYQTGGSTTGASISWLPSAPSGIVFTPLGGGLYRISGTLGGTGTVTYTYTINTTGPCVKPPATGTITANALPVAAFTVSPIRCANSTINFTNTSTPNAAGTTTWAWSFGDPNADPPGGPNENISTILSPSHYYLVPNTTTGYTVTLNAINSNGCISNPDASVIVMVNDTPRAGFIVPNVCINDVATVFPDTSKPAAILGAPWYWNFGETGSPTNITNTQNGSHLYATPGVYHVYHGVTITATGCVDTADNFITISSADPVAAFTATNACSADSVDLLNQSTVGFGNVTKIEIYWTGAGVPEVINFPIFNHIYRHKYPTLQTTQTYTIRVVAYSGIICSNTLTKNVTVYATPKVQFNNIPSTCYLVAPFQITQASEIGGVPGTGTYSGPGITNPNGTFNPQVAGIGTHDIKYTFTASNPGACIDTLTKTITVLDTAHAVFSVALPSCEKIPTVFTNLSTTPASVTLVSTVWDFGDLTGPQTFLIASPITHLYAGPGPYTVTMHNVSDNLPVGCLSTDTAALINIDPDHSITFDATGGSKSQTRCVNVAIQDIKFTLAGGANDIVMPVAGLPAGLTATVSGSGPYTVTISGAPTTAVGSPFNYTILTKGNTCAVASETGTITVEPDHEIKHLSSAGDSIQSVCLNTAINDIKYDLGGGATGAIVSGLPAGVSYSVTGTMLTITGTPVVTVPYLFKYMITTTGNSCVKASDSGSIRVNPYPVPNFAVDKPSYCIPNALVLFDNTSSMPDGNPNMTYSWNFGEFSNPTNTSSGFEPSHWYLSEGPFNVHLIVTSVPVSGPGCSHDTTIAITTIHPQPKADFVYSKPSVCIGDNVTITDATDGKDGIVNQWHWDMGDAGVRITNPVTYTYPDTITYTITMYSINSHGCNSDTVSKPFTVYPYPKVNAGPDKFVLEGGSVELEATAFARQPVYSWTPIDYLTDSKILRPRTMDPKTDMTYRLTVTGQGGCQLSDDVFVKLLKFPAIPNTFTPNGDGINDLWRIDYLNTYPDNRVQIFTRAGKVVFESKGYSTPWDGTLKGKPLPFDTYYYIIEPGNGRDPITGYITILK